MTQQFRIIAAFSCIFLLSTVVKGQYFYGNIADQEGKPIEGAIVVWVNSSKGATANAEGDFVLPMPDTTAKSWKIAALFQGVSDTFAIDDLHAYWTLKMNATLVMTQVTIEGKPSGSYISVLEPIKTEIINRAELRKAACCDLAGCFETQATVQPQTTNILTNAKELRILGLSGVYNQVLVDGFPLIQGLTYTYGISTIPGSAVENIWVTKGANSVLQGYESISGQINVITRTGEKAERLYVNGYINNFREKHLNVSTAIKGKKSQHYAIVHLIGPAGKVDRDSDTFLDLPRLSRIMALHKWHYGSETADGWSASTNLRFTREQRIGGQKSFDPSVDKGSSSIYGQVVNFYQPELGVKLGYRFDAHWKLSWIASAFGQKQNAWYGPRPYEAVQKNGYSNIQIEYNYGNANQHNVKAGYSLRYQNLREDAGLIEDSTLQIVQTRFTNKTLIPGFFAENTAVLKEKWTWIVGVRVDKHPDYGWYFAPRTLLRYAVQKNTDLRFSVGTGWRTVNLFAENITLLGSSRILVFKQLIKPEKALNTGMNLVQRFSLKPVDFTFSADFYHTRFYRQFFPDYDSEPGKAIIANFEGKSVSNGIQFDLGAALNSQWSLKFAYNFLDVFRVENGVKTALPFNSRHRLLGVVSYLSKNRKWQADVNTHWFGKQRLPNTALYPEIYRQPDFSQSYSVASVQLTRSFKRWEVYAGCENVLDFRQLKPILSWQDPYSPYFDTAFAWGPTRGREIYLGFRFKIP